MPYTRISEHIYLLASRIVLSFDTPSTVVDALKEFEKLFEDDNNFFDSDEWGKKAPDGDKIVPFSLSSKGMAKVRDLMNRSETFKRIHQVGVAGIRGEKHSLLYFLTQYFSVIGNMFEYVNLQLEKDKDSKVVTDLKKKMNKLKSVYDKLNLRKLYTDIPDKKYTPEEFKHAKERVLNLIRDVSQDFESVGELSPEEKKYFQ